ncbi:MAG: hypothetical protein RMJ87_12170 [Cytophagales bacterium]|nr:hypothetical protein [Bernardetiaceae bacterium]MDW8205777.1 hypothetical protein [Cytophagales bacterium]
MQVEDKYHSNYIFCNTNGSVQYDEQCGCVLLTLKGYAQGSEYRDLMNQAILLLKKHNCSKLLGNTSQSEVIPLEDQDWTNSEWAERAIQAGLRYNAIVLAEDIFGRLSIESITESAKTVVVQYFNSLSEAKKWLNAIA